MSTTQNTLQGVVNYEKLSVLNALVPLEIKKDEIPNYFICSNYEKAVRKIDQKMERYEGKIANLESELNSQLELIQRANRETSGYVDTTNAQAVARHNDWVDRGRKAIEKRDDLKLQYDDALDEAKEKLQELQDDALIAIDEDIVAVLDKCNKIADKLSNSQNSDDLMAALEICFIELKIFHFFEDFIDGNAARRDAKDRIAETNDRFVELCTNEDVRNHITDMFRRNIFLVENNDKQYGQIVQVIEGVDQKEMDAQIQALQDVFNEEFKTHFNYEAVIDPSELQNLLTEINRRSNEIKENIARAKNMEEGTKSLAEEGVGSHKEVKRLLEVSEREVENMGDELIPPNHFFVEMLTESVIDEFYSRDLRPKVMDFRSYLADELEEEKLDRFIMTEEDRYSLQKIENVIKEANLTRLQQEREKISEHISNMDALIEELQQTITKVEAIPKERSAELKADYTRKSILSCLPFIGFIFGFSIFQKFKSFESAFKSTNETYRDTGISLISRNKTMTIVNLIVGAVLSVGVAVAFFVLETSFSASIKLGLPGAMLLLYLASSGLLFLAGKKLASYLGLST